MFTPPHLDMFRLRRSRATDLYRDGATWRRLIEERHAHRRLVALRSAARYAKLYRDLVTERNA